MPQNIDRSQRTMPPAVIDVMATARPTPLRQVAPAIIACAAAALLFGSQALLSWANDLPIGPTSDTILSITQAWDDGLRKLGLPTIATELRSMFRRFQGWGRN